MLKEKTTTELKQLEDLSNTTDNNTFLVEFEQLENTPFTIVKKEDEFFGVLGEHRVTEIFNNIDELKKDLEQINWNRIIQVIWGVVEKFKNIENINKEN